MYFYFPYPRNGENHICTVKSGIQYKYVHTESLFMVTRDYTQRYLPNKLWNFYRLSYKPHVQTLQTKNSIADQPGTTLIHL